LYLFASKKLTFQKKNSPDPKRIFTAEKKAVSVVLITNEYSPTVKTPRTRHDQNFVAQCTQLIYNFFPTCFDNFDRWGNLKKISQASRDYATESLKSGLKTLNSDLKFLKFGLNPYVTRPEYLEIRPKSFRTLYVSLKSLKFLESLKSVLKSLKFLKYDLKFLKSWKPTIIGT